MNPAIGKMAALACGAGLLLGGGALAVGMMSGNGLVQAVAAKYVSPGCPQERERMGEALGRLGVLDVRPPGARPSKRYAGCEPDDDLAYADQSYTLRDTHEAVPALYRSAAVRDGWKVVPGVRPEDDDVDLLCLTKVVNGQKAFIGVRTNKTGGGDYHLAVRSAATGGVLCW
ncbi:hypothetical protein DP939_23520 [Spongiactinospora rosea]|uniref:Uncharacterized protein n=1 Tax=Spongiactinospora rosea TaxID=2248750 RepID=A0A366LV79_9ACTN|nr:hypothetical protein [Spongiactinospora rosea]RBQ17831.1 hypothetical protein DP939_23520 [Spongiactinospora rosea]